MTCIVGLVDEDHVYIGGDSAAVAGYESRETKLEKVFKICDFVIGYTTSFRMGQILEHHLSVRRQHADEADMAYMVLAFIPAVRECLKANGFSQIHDNKEEGGRFLVGYRNRLFSIQDDFQVNEMADGFDACGCGMEYALGALKALQGFDAKPRVEQALKAAEHFCGAVRSPFVILRT